MASSIDWRPFFQSRAFDREQVQLLQKLFEQFSFSIDASAAPAGAQFVTLAADSTLTAERILTAGAGVSVTDAAPNVTVANTDRGSTAVAAHEAAVDPHPQYLTGAEGDAAYQPLDADLTALAALASTGVIERTGANTYALRTADVVGRALLALASAGAIRFIRVNADGSVDLRAAADYRGDLGLGTMSTQDANNVAIIGGTINGTSIGATTPSTGAFTTLSAGQTTITSDALPQAKVQRGTAGNVRFDIVRPSLSTEVAQIVWGTGAALEYQAGLIADTNLRIRSIGSLSGIYIDTAGQFFAENNATITGTLSASGNAAIGGASLPGTARLGVAGGRTFLGANNEIYALGLSYSSTLGNACYIGASNSATPDMVFSNAAGTELVRFAHSGAASITGTLSTTGNASVGGSLNLTNPSQSAAFWFDGAVRRVAWFADTGLNQFSLARYDASGNFLERAMTVAYAAGGAVSITGPISASNLAGTTYTPTLRSTVDVNISSSTFQSASYIRVGSAVMATIQLFITPTASGSVRFSISLPVASNLTNAYQLGGNCAARDTVPLAGMVIGSATNDNAVAEFVAATTNAHEVTVQIIYPIN